MFCLYLLDDSHHDYSALVDVPSPHALESPCEWDSYSNEYTFPIQTSLHNRHNDS